MGGGQNAGLQQSTGTVQGLEVMFHLASYFGSISLEDLRAAPMKRAGREVSKAKEMRLYM